jgi:hypothetical protein
MIKKSFIPVAMATVLVFPVVARAHEGHLHKVTGTVASVNGNHVTVKAADGKSVMIMLDSKTVVSRGKAKLDATAVKVGERVVVEGTEEKEMITAKTVKLGAAASTTTTAKKPTTTAKK